MHARWARFAVPRVVAVTVVAAVVTAGGVVAATADATDSAQPIIIGSCATSVTGAPGTPIELSPSAVLAPVVNIVQTLDPLSLITPTFRNAFAALPPIPIGVVPNGQGTISGSQIGDAVAAQLSKTPLGLLLATVTSTVQQTLTSMCGVAVTGVNAVAAPVQNGTAGIASASNQAAQAVGLAPKSGTSGGSPGQTGTSGGSGATQSGGGTTGGGGNSGMPASNSPVIGGLPAGLSGGSSLFAGGTLLDYGLAESPLARYAGIPFAAAGLFDPSPGVKYGGSVPGYSPSYGVLGQDSNSNGQPDDVRTAGHAEAFNPGGTLGNGVGLPMLLAVLMLAGVTAALVRTWVLRKVRVS